jgi:hypothetical protein
MNYEEMSDSDINSRVRAEVSRLGIRGGDPFYGDENLSWDYCNNPSDAWPIVTGSKIGFVPVNGTWRASSVTAGYHECSNENPLRAAMIVFLRMASRP